MAVRQRCLLRNVAGGIRAKAGALVVLYVCCCCSGTSSDQTTGKFTVCSPEHLATVAAGYEEGLCSNALQTTVKMLEKRYKGAPDTSAECRLVQRCARCIGSTSHDGKFLLNTNRLHAFAE